MYRNSHYYIQFQSDYTINWSRLISRSLYRLRENYKPAWSLTIKIRESSRKQKSDFPSRNFLLLKFKLRLVRQLHAFQNHQRVKYPEVAHFVEESLDQSIIELLTEISTPIWVAGKREAMSAPESKSGKPECGERVTERDLFWVKSQGQISVSLCRLIEASPPSTSRESEGVPFASFTFEFFFYSCKTETEKMVKSKNCEKTRKVEKQLPDSGSDFTKGKHRDIYH